MEIRGDGIGGLLNFANQLKVPLINISGNRYGENSFNKLGKAFSYCSLFNPTEYSHVN